MEQGLEARQGAGGQEEVRHRAVGEGHGAAAIDAGEMVFVPIAGGEQALAAGQMATAHQAPLLQLPQVAIHRGQPHGVVALAQAGVKILAGELAIRTPQFTEQSLLTSREVDAGGSLHSQGFYPAGSQIVWVATC